MLDFEWKIVVSTDLTQQLPFWMRKCQSGWEKPTCKISSPVSQHNHRLNIPSIPRTCSLLSSTSLWYCVTCALAWATPKIELDLGTQLGLDSARLRLEFCMDSVWLGPDLAWTRLRLGMSGLDYSPDLNLSLQFRVYTLLDSNVARVYCYWSWCRVLVSVSDPFGVGVGPLFPIPVSVLVLVSELLVSVLVLVSDLPVSDTTLAYMVLMCREDGI